MFDEQGLAATVIRRRQRLLEIRTEQVVGLRRGAGAPSDLGRPERRAFAGALPAAPPRQPFGAPVGEPSVRLASPSASPSASASPNASASPGASAAPGASASPSRPAPAGNTEIPTDGQLGAIATALQAQFGPIASRRRSRRSARSSAATSSARPRS